MYRYTTAAHLGFWWISGEFLAEEGKGVGEVLLTCNSNSNRLCCVLYVIFLVFMEKIKVFSVEMFFCGVSQEEFSLNKFPHNFAVSVSVSIYI